MQYRGGASAASPMYPHIYKDPPKAIFTRKKERVNIADVQYMVQADAQYGDPTRINEGIQLYARGQNPMVEVSYSNAGGASTNSALGNAQVSNPYKLDTVRPPLTPIEDRVPLSNPRIHQNYSITTNPQIYPQTIAGEYDKSVVRLMTSGYTLPMGTVRSNFSVPIQKSQERYAEHMARALNSLLNGNLNSTKSIRIDTTRDTTTKDTSNATKEGFYTSATAGKTASLDKTRDVNVKSTLNTVQDALYVSATPTLYFPMDKTREVNTKSTLNTVHEDMKTIVVSPVWNYNIDPTRDVNQKYVTETKDVSLIAATSPITFTNITVYDPRTNTNIMVEANIKEKNAVSVCAAAGVPLVFNTNDGKEIKLKDYEYKVVTAPAGNSQMVIYVRQPDVTLDRSSPLYAVQTNLMLQGLDNSTQRAVAEQITLQSVLPFTSATSHVKLHGYNDDGSRLANDAQLYNLQQGLPQTSGQTNVALGAQGYNEELARDSKVKELDKLSNFGSFMDRATRPNFAIRG